MPELKKIIIQNFRNIALQELEFSPNVNCISGGNGEGKTNLLDAICYLSMTKSAFAIPDRYNIRYGSASFALSGLYTMSSGQSTKITMQYSPSEGKQLRADDKPYSKLSEHIGLLPIVMVSPADAAMVSESGDERRRLLNSVLSQMDRQYLSSLQQYNRVLAQRNRLLKDGEPDHSLLDTFDEQLSALAAPICAKRASFCESLVPTLSRYYSEISSGREEVDIVYQSDSLDGSLLSKLQERRQRDRLLHFTSAGPQRDDFVFKMDGEPIKRCGSQGQQKSFLVALKFAQHELMRQSYGFPPIMLLDDLFDKLDPKRIERLLSMVTKRDFGQIFITDPDKQRTRAVVDSLTQERSYLVASDGTFSTDND